MLAQQPWDQRSCRIRSKMFCVIVIRITFGHLESRYKRCREGREVTMHQRMVDRWIEAAEADRVCEWVMGEQRLVRPITPMPQPLLLMTKSRAI
jgi:hypothetical protein